MMMGIIKTVDIHCSQLNIINFQLVNSVQFPIQPYMLYSKKWSFKNSRMVMVISAEVLLLDAL